MVIDCRSIHSSSLKTPQPDLAAFLFMQDPFMFQRQQHVFIYGRVVA